jgi:hypothetical protein
MQQHAPALRNYGKLPSSALMHPLPIGRLKEQAAQEFQDFYSSFPGSDMKAFTDGSKLANGLVALHDIRQRNSSSNSLSRSDRIKRVLMLKQKQLLPV